MNSTLLLAANEREKKVDQFFSSIYQFSITSTSYRTSNEMRNDRVCACVFDSYHLLWSYLFFLFLCRSPFSALFIHKLVDCVDVVVHIVRMITETHNTNSSSNNNGKKEEGEIAFILWNKGHAMFAYTQTPTHTHTLFDVRNPVLFAWRRLPCRRACGVVW